MAEIITIARPYAKAVFELAVEKNELGKWADRLAEMAAIAENADMRAVMINPTMNDNSLAELFLSMVKSPIDDSAKNFIHVLIHNGRLGLLPQIHSMFVELKDAYEGIAEADVVSAFPISDAELSTLAATLEKHFKRKIKPAVHVDKELIGGVKVIVGDEVLDTSVRAQLQSMAVALQSSF